MSLLRLKSDLKSLKYGDFQTKDPLITKDINNPPSNNTLSMEVTRRIDDTVRIVKLLVTKPGISFVAKQAALEVVKQSMNSDGKEKILKSLAAAGLNTAKILASTIAQIPVNGTGTHFVRGFAGKQGYLGVSGIEFFGKDKEKTPPKVITSLSPSGSIHSPLDETRKLSNFNPVEPTTSELQVTSLIKKEVRVNLGDQGIRKNKINYSDISEDLSDKINKLNPTTDVVEGTKEGRDLIKFRFHVLDSESNKETNIFFRAFLDSFDDSYSGNWNTHNYIGRGENFYTYSGFNRDISLSFKIAASTRQEMFPLYRKMVMLASTTAPTYGKGSFMKGTIVGLTVGDYIHRTYGIIQSVNFTWEKDYPWEITMKNPEGEVDKDQQELPMVMNCSVKFTPIHNFVPQTGLYHFITNDEPKGEKKRVFEKDNKSKYNKFD